mmetsp:Transcript_2503/g.4634  ORF Transcript_2503/g.4634 Transcript_2503/m.4634 type:complete len:103 (-) Transcript_2503:93-401(-)
MSSLRLCHGLWLQPNFIRSRNLILSSSVQFARCFDPVPMVAPCTHSLDLAFPLTSLGFEQKQHTWKENETKDKDVLLFSCLFYIYSHSSRVRTKKKNTNIHF